MPTFHTVKEAAKLTSKSPSSIRRIIYPILEDDKHPDRHHIQPSPEKAKELRIKGENFAWKISDKLLRREIPEGESTTSTATKSSTHSGPDNAAAIVDILRKQLDIKDQQIAAANDVIKGLSERVREGNLLLNSLQQQLALSDGSSRPKSDVVDVETPSSTPEKKDTADDRKTPSVPPEKGSDAAPKKTHWLFKKIF